MTKNVCYGWYLNVNKAEKYWGLIAVRPKQNSADLLRYYQSRL